MREPKFEWGPLPRGIYIGMLWFTIVIGWHFTNLLIYYVPLLIFLGIGLRPFLEISGLYDFFCALSEKIEDKRWDKINAKRRKEVQSAERAKKYKNMRYKDPKLPKDW